MKLPPPSEEAVGSVAVSGFLLLVLAALAVGAILNNDFTALLALCGLTLREQLPARETPASAPDRKD